MSNTAVIPYKRVLLAATVFGLIEAAVSSCITGCLLGVTLSTAVSIIFFILFVAFLAAFIVLAWRMGKREMFISAIAFGVVMPVAAFGSLIVGNLMGGIGLVDKTPLFICIAMALFLIMTFMVVTGMRRMTWQGFRDRYFIDNRSVMEYVLVNVVMGFVIGLSFGLSKPEMDSAVKKTTIMSIVFLFVGLFAGAGFAVYREFIAWKQWTGHSPINDNENEQ